MDEALSFSSGILRDATGFNEYRRSANATSVVFTKTVSSCEGEFFDHKLQNLMMKLANLRLSSKVLISTHI